MAVAVSCDTSDAPTFVRFTLEGDCASAEELINLRRALIRTGQFTAKSCVLLDLRGANTFPDVQALLAAFQADGVWPICRAFVVNNAVQYQIAQQLQSALGAQTTINQIFHDETVAMEWLAALAAHAHSIRA
jgi:hypothetical protein